MTAALRASRGGQRAVPHSPSPYADVGVSATPTVVCPVSKLYIRLVLHPSPDMCINISIFVKGIMATGHASRLRKLPWE